MEKRIASFISYLFHPLLMPTYMMAIIFSQPVFISSCIPTDKKLFILAYVFIVTFLFPVALSFVFLKMKIIHSLRMETRQERTLPYLSTIIFYYAIYYLMKSNEIFIIYQILFLAIILVTILCFFINFKFKISIHTMAIGALTGIMIGLSIRLNITMLMFILPLFIISGLIGFARLALNAHRSIEVYTGYLLGIGFMLLMFFFL